MMYFAPFLTVTLSNVCDSVPNALATVAAIDPERVES